MTRCSDWASRLDLFLTQNAARCFLYGTWDCCLFVCDAIEAMTAHDLAVEWRGRYHSAKEAKILIRKFCGGRTASLAALVERVAEHVGMPEIDVMHAQRGDVALFRRAGTWSLGLIGLGGQVIVPYANGLMVVSKLKASRAWKV